MLAYLAAVKGLFERFNWIKIFFIAIFCVVAIVSIFSIINHIAEHVKTADDLSITRLQLFGFSFPTVVLIASFLETLLVFFVIFAFNEIDFDEFLRYKLRRFLYSFTISFIINLFCDSLISVTFQGQALRQSAIFTIFVIIESLTTVIQQLWQEPAFLIKTAPHSSVSRAFVRFELWAL